MTSPPDQMNASMIPSPLRRHQPIEPMQQPGELEIPLRYRNPSFSITRWEARLIGSVHEPISGNPNMPKADIQSGLADPWCTILRLFPAEKPRPTSCPLRTHPPSTSQPTKRREGCGKPGPW